jgi:hypothetical protein
VTKAEISEKRKVAREKRNKKCALQWAMEAPEMAPFINMEPSELDLTCPSNDMEKRLFAIAETVWQKHELLGIFVPQITKATWNNIPYRAKAAGFMECRKAGLPWNIDEYNDKAASRLGKLRSKGSALCAFFLIVSIMTSATTSAFTGPHKRYRDDPSNAVRVNTPVVNLFREFRGAGEYISPALPLFYLALHLLWPLH